jgi:HSP20 family protein
MAVKDFLPTIWHRDMMPSKRQDDDPLYALQQDMNRIFDDFFANFPLSAGVGLSGRLGEFSPSIDIKESEREVTIKVELPGVDEKDIDVALTNDMLTIEGEKKEEKEEKGKGYYHAERTYGSFRRMLQLPAGIDSKKAEASFKKGVLTIKVPKTEEAKSKVQKIAIKTE